MGSGNRNLRRDLALRGSGAALLILGALALRGLFMLVHAGPTHEASPAELALAALAFVPLSAGTALVWLGRHVLDEVPISRRWAAGVV